MSELTKRKACSPCESSKVKAKILQRSSSSEADASFVSAEMSDNDKADLTKDVTYRVRTKDGQPFIGALDRQQAYEVWKKGLKYSKDLVFGISLVQMPDMPFCIDYRLKTNIDRNEAKQNFKFTLEGFGVLEGELVIPKPPPPKLGEEVLVTITKTRFKLEPEQVDTWLSLFGRIVKKSEFIIDQKCEDEVRSDDISCVMVLRKHIPSVLPAYGRKMMIRYPGQPLQCNRCYDSGHLKKKCEAKENVEWSVYVKVVLRELKVDEKMLGDWMKMF